MVLGYEEIINIAYFTVNSTFSPWILIYTYLRNSLRKGTQLIWPPLNLLTPVPLTNGPWGFDLDTLQSIKDKKYGSIVFFKLCNSDSYFWDSLAGDISEGAITSSKFVSICSGNVRDKRVILTSCIVSLYLFIYFLAFDVLLSAMIFYSSTNTRTYVHNSSVAIYDILWLFSGYIYLKTFSIFCQTSRIYFIFAIHKSIESRSSFNVASLWLLFFIRNLFT